MPAPNIPYPEDLVINPETGEVTTPVGAGGAPPSRAPSSVPSPERQAPSGGKGPDTTKASWPDKTGPFDKQEWIDAGLKTPPQEWEYTGYQRWYYDNSGGRAQILQDIARARAGAKGVSVSDIAKFAGVGAEQVDAEKLRKLPRRKIEELDLTVRRSPKGQRLYAGRQEAIRLGLIKPTVAEVKVEEVPEVMTKQELAEAEARGRAFVETAKRKKYAAGLIQGLSTVEKRKLEDRATQTPDGYWIPNYRLEDIKQTSPQLADILTTEGYGAYQKRITQERTLFERNLAKSNPQLFNLYRKEGGEAYDAVVNEWSKANPDANVLAQYLDEDTRKVYNESSARDQFSILQGAGLTPLTTTYTGEHNGKPLITQSTGYEHQVLTGKGLDVLVMGAEILVPGLYVARHWKDLSTAEKAIFIALDVATVALPVAGAVTRGARAASSFGRLAMLKGALRGVGAEALAQAKAPVTMILHPVATAKATAGEVRTLVENIAHGRKIPEAVLTTTYGTVRIPVGKNMSKAEVMAARDKLMLLVARGEKPIVEIGGRRIELAVSPFMREVGGGATHATPMGEKFEKGIRISDRLYIANEPLTRFATVTSGGLSGERSVIIIIPPELAVKSVPSNKLWQNTAELERVLLEGSGELGPPVQKLYTRIGVNGQKVELWLYKPLTAKQIAKLKLEGLIEAIKAPFKPAIKIKGKGRLAGLTDR